MVFVLLVGCRAGGSRHEQIPRKKLLGPSLTFLNYWLKKLKKRCQEKWECIFDTKSARASRASMEKSHIYGGCLVYIWGLGGSEQASKIHQCI